MHDLGKRNVLGVRVDALDYESAVARIISAAKAGRGYSITALAVHGVMTGVTDPAHRHRLNRFDMITPDGQPVRWALNLLHRTKLRDRVYGPNLMREVLRAAGQQGLPVYLYGSKQSTVELLAKKVQEDFPGLKVAGFEPSKFRPLQREEKRALTKRITESGAKILFVGLGCPRQEVFAYEYRDHVKMPIMAIGAAFDYLSGLLPEPPAIYQRLGLQWAYRWVQEPKRLFKRYAFLNPAFLSLLAAQKLGIWEPDPESAEPPDLELGYG